MRCHSSSHVQCAVGAPCARDGGHRLSQRPAPSRFVANPLRGSAPPRSRNVVLQEATSSDNTVAEQRRLAAEQLVERTSSNGASPSGGTSNGAHANGANGASYTMRENGVSTNGNGASSNGVRPHSNGAVIGNGTAGTTAEVVTEAAAEVVADAVPLTPMLVGPPGPGGRVEIEMDSMMDPCASGQLETCAADRITSSLEEEAELTAAAVRLNGASPAAAEPAGAAAAPRPPVSAAGTPYASPGGRWQNFQKYSTFQRTWQIWSFAFLFFMRYWLLGRKWSYGRKGMTEQRVKERKSKLAVWLREGLVKLGPTFIKIGQQFSTRVDVLSPEFVKQLELLQDNVPAFDSRQAMAIVERNLGAPISAKFESFDPQPIAAASLGQVHLAQINGERVVVKVQRPGLKSLFDIDLKNIRVIAEWFQKLDPQSDGAARDWVAIYDECSRILYQEIDYRLEGANADRFRENFAGTDWIKVPKIRWDYTSSEVLTMEYCPGVKINRISELDRLGLDRQRLARLSVESYLQQLLRYGFFHADPHPGNIAVDTVGGGRLVYYDFGMMGSIPNDVRGGLLELFYGVYEKDADRCLDALVTMGVLIPGPDMTAVRRTAQFFLNNFEERLRQQRAEAAANPEYSSTFKGELSKEEKQAKRKQILSSIGEDLLLASADKPFRFPATFTFVVRSFTVLDGIGKGLNPRFDISEIAAPYARSLLLEGNPQYAKLLKEFNKGLSKQNRAVKNLFRGPNLIDDVATTVRGLERGDIKLRVRALEAERALNRVLQQQKVTTAAVVASTCVNAGTVLSVSAMSAAATAAFCAAGVSGVFLLINWVKYQRMERKEALLSGA